MAHFELSESPWLGKPAPNLLRAASYGRPVPPWVTPSATCNAAPPISPATTFAYQVRETDLDPRVGGYGADAVMFQSGGAPAYHADQVIFYGPYMRRTRITVLRHMQGSWQAERAGKIVNA